MTSLSPSVLIIGAGAIGSLVAAQFARTDAPITLVGRTDTVNALRQGGLRITEQGSTTVWRTIRPVVGLAEAFAGGETYGLAILAVKSYDTAQVLAELLAATDAPPPVLTLQNGVGNEEILAAGLGPQSVIAGAITTPVSLPEPGHLIVERPRKQVGVADLEPDAIGAAAPVLPAATVVAMLSGAGFQARTYTHWRSLKWTKLVMNLLCNASCALLGWTPDQVWSDRHLADLEIAAWREAIQVLRGLGSRLVNFGGYPLGSLEPLLTRTPLPLLRPVLGRFVIAGRGGKRPSLQIDLDSGKQESEVGWLNGAVVSNGMALGLPVPANRVLFEALDAVIRGREPAIRYRNRPDALLARWHGLQ